MINSLCKECRNGIFCPTWGEYKCKAYMKRIYREVTACDAYSKRPKDFKETPCQCEDCLDNEKLWEEE